MPPKGKVPGGKDGLDGGLPESSAEDLSYFQSVFSDFRKSPNAFSGKGSRLNDVERLANTSENETTQRLARLCYVRIKLEQAKAKEDLVAGLDDAKTRLAKIPRSLSGLCLLAAWLFKAGESSAVGWESVSEGLTALAEECETGNADAWVDPIDEAIVTIDAKPQVFDAIPLGHQKSTKQERVDQLAKYLKGTVKKAADRKSASILSLAPKQPAESLTPEGQQAIASLKESRLRLAEEVELFEKQRSDRQAEQTKMLALIGKKLKDAGPEGSPERVGAMCDFFKLNWNQFEEALLQELDGCLKGELNDPKVKSMYTAAILGNVRQFKSARRWMLWKTPSLVGLLEKSVEQHCAEADLMLIKEGERAKDEAKGEGGGGGKGGKKGGGKGGKAGDKDKDKAAAPGGATDGAADDRAGQQLVGLDEVLTWFLRSIEAHGKEIQEKIVEKAAAAELPLSASCPYKMEIVKGLKPPSLTQTFHVKYFDGDVVESPKAEADASSRLFRELIRRARVGEPLLQPFAASEAAKDSDNLNWLDRTLLQRVAFTSELSQFPVLQRHDIIDSIAQRYAILITYGSQEGKDAEVLPPAFDMPDNPKAVLERLGDPVTTLGGYGLVLRRRRLLPLSRPRKLPPPEYGGPPLDETGLRLARLAEFVLTQGEGASVEQVLTCITVHHSTKKEHVELVRRLYGELPMELVEQLREEEEKAKRAANGEPDANGDAAADEGKEDQPQEAFRPFLEFDFREDLPAAEREALNEEWRRDIVDALRVMEDGGCGLGPRFAATVAAFIAESLATGDGDGAARPPKITVSSTALPPHLAKLPGKALLHLRYFVLSQLGGRLAGTELAIRDRVDELETYCRERDWGVEVVSGGGAPGSDDCVRLSPEAYRALVAHTRAVQLRDEQRLRVAHAMAAAMQGRGIEDPAKVAAQCLEAAAAAGSASGAAAGGGAAGAAGGKRKGGKGGGGAEALARWEPLCRLPPLTGGSEVRYPERELCDYYAAKDVTELELRSVLLDTSTLLCSAEITEMVAAILDPPQDIPEPGTPAADADLIQELLTFAPCWPPFADPCPVFTIKDVVEETARASLMDGLWRSECEKLREAVARVFKHWEELLQAEDVSAEDRDKILEGVKPALSSWSYELLAKAARAPPPGSPQISAREALSELYSDCVDIREGAFRLLAHTALISGVQYAARLKDAEDFADHLHKRYEAEAKKAEAEAKSAAAAGGKGPKQPKPTKASELEQRRLQELNNALQTAQDEKKWLHEIRASLCAHVELIELHIKDAKGSGGGSGFGKYGPRTLGPSASGPPSAYTPEIAAQQMLSVLRALQLYSLHMSVLEMSTEQVAWSARAALRSAIINEPLLEIGALGTGICRSWLQAKIRNVQSSLTAAELMEEESETKKEKAKNQKAEDKNAAKERQRREALRKDREAEEERERERMREAEEEERKRREREREEQERKEEEARTKKAAEEEAKKRQPRSVHIDQSLYHIVLDTNWDKEEEPEKRGAPGAGAAAPPRGAQPKGQQAGKGGKDAAGPGPAAGAAPKAAIKEPASQPGQPRGGLAASLAAAGQPGPAQPHRDRDRDRDRDQERQQPAPRTGSAAPPGGGRRDGGPPPPSAPPPAAGPAGKAGSAGGAAPGGGGGGGGGKAGAPAAAAGKPPGGGAAGAEGGAQRKGSGPAPQQQQQQQQRQPSSRDSAPAGPSGREAEKGGRGGAPAAAGQPGGGGGGRGDRGGQGAQQQQGGKGGKGGGAAAQAAAAAAAAATAAKAAAPKAPSMVPGFDPESHPDAKGKAKRRRGGGGGGGGGAGGQAEAATGEQGRGGAHRPAASGAEGGDAWGDEQEEAATTGDVLDLTGDDTAAAAPAEEQADPFRDYPLVYPYPFEPPPGWMVYEGFLFHEGAEDPDIAFQNALAGLPDVAGDPAKERSFRITYLITYAGYGFKGGLPPVPPAAIKSSGQAAAPATQLPYAVAAEVLMELPEQPAAADTVEPAAAAAAFPPPAPFPHGPPLGAPFGAPPLFSPQVMPPGFLGGAMRPPLPAGVAALGQMPPPPLAGMPGMPPFMGGPYGAGHMRPPMPGPPAAGPHMESPSAPAGEEEDNDDDDLLGLLGVATSTEKLPTPAPAQTAGYGFPPPPMPMPQYGAPAGLYGLAGMPPSFAHHQPPPAAEEQQVDVEMDEQRHDLPPPPAAAAAPHEEAHGQGRAHPAPAAPQPKSWAQLAAKGGPAAATAAAAAHTRPAARPVGRAPVPHHQAAPSDVADPEEEAYQAVIHESMRLNRDAAFPPLGGAAAGGPGAGAGAAARDAAGQDLGVVMAGTGLVNRVGEYNCFLNVIIQCLWHCSAFRAQLSPRRPEDFEAGGHLVVAALLRLFRALDSADATRQAQQAALAQRGSGESAAERHVVDPSELREALDALGVRAGEMNDASEVLGALFDCLNRAPGLAGQQPAPGQPVAQAEAGLSLVDRTFGLLVSEEVRCRKAGCGKITHVVPLHVEYFIILTATGLREVPALIECAGRPSMGRVIREIEAQHFKRCDNDPPHRGCNTPTPVTRSLHNVPSVFSVQLAWEPDVPGDAIAGTLSHVDTILDPKEVFPNGNCPDDLPCYALHGMFCYYGQHYFAFINRGPTHPDSAQEWVMFDDATVSAVGGWAAVIAKCRAGRIQPSVLFYQQLPR